jgi:STE24 endopeptidase
MSGTLTPAQQAAQMVDSLGPEALAQGRGLYHRQSLAVAGQSGGIGAGRAGHGAPEAARPDRRRFADPQRFFATFTVSAAFLLISTLIALPWTIYTDWHRERAYDLSSQPLGDFLGQMAISEALGACWAGCSLPGLCPDPPHRRALVAVEWRASRRGDPAMLLAGPPLIEPLFNDYKPVPPGEVRTALEQIADDVGIPHDRIFMYDGSRQSDRFTANVSGIGPAARIAISDVALKEASLAEVRAVTGHEAGHYKLGHVWRSVDLLPLLAMLLFFLLNRLFAPTARLLGSDARLDEPAACRFCCGGIGAGPACHPDHQHPDPRGRDRGRSLFAPDRERARCAGQRAGEDRRIPLSAPLALAGGAVLHPPLGRKPGADGDGVEGAHPKQSAPDPE